MTLYARIIHGVVAALNSQAGFDATDPSVQYLWQPVPDGTLPGATVHVDGSVNNATATGADIVVDVPTFLLLFTSAERIALRSSGDTVVKDFLSLVDDPRTQRINLSLNAVQEAIFYLAGQGPSPMATPILTVARAEAILTGQGS